ncbi:MAG: hypothetical protein INR71_01440, partial [Terriglobus roseus]|nr:hypothetical protein [Terriglobus roseus]
VLEGEINDYEKIVGTTWRDYSSTDPLDLGMMLWTTHWLANEENWATGLGGRAERDLMSLFEQGYFARAKGRRTAFRELGTCLGLRTALAPEAAGLAEGVVTFWQENGPMPEPTERCPEDESGVGSITMVMYAAALVPGGRS